MFYVSLEVFYLTVGMMHLIRRWVVRWHFLLQKTFPQLSPSFKFGDPKYITLIIPIINRRNFIRISIDKHKLERVFAHCQPYSATQNIQKYEIEFLNSFFRKTNLDFSENAWLTCRLNKIDGPHKMDIVPFITLNQEKSYTEVTEVQLLLGAEIICCCLKLYINFNKIINFSLSNEWMASVVSGRIEQTRYLHIWG